MVFLNIRWNYSPLKEKVAQVAGRPFRFCAGGEGSQKQKLEMQRDKAAIKNPHCRNAGGAEMRRKDKAGVRLVFGAKIVAKLQRLLRLALQGGAEELWV
jgi:hypothetical protein